MAFKKVREIVQDVVLMLAQVDGASVQRYSEDRYNLYVQQAFDLIFDKVAIPEYLTWITSDLDGSYGSPTADISAIKRFQDIIAVYPAPDSSGNLNFTESEHTPLPRVPLSRFNPNRLSGTTAKFIDSDTIDNKVIRIFPKTSTTQIDIRAKLMPDAFTPDSIPKLQSTFLANMVAWFASEDDGTNPGATDKFKTISEQQFQDYVKAVANQEGVIDAASYGDNFLSEWREQQ